MLERIEKHLGFDRSPWLTFVDRHPSVTYDSPEYQEEQRLLSESGYRGTGHYATKHEAKAVLEAMLDAVAVLDPAVGWKGVGSYSRIDRGTGYPEEGRVHLAF